MKWPKKQEIQCSIQNCNKAVKLNNNTVDEIRKKLEYADWAKTLRNPRCSKHKNLIKAHRQKGEVTKQEAISNLRKKINNLKA